MKTYAGTHRFVIVAFGLVFKIARVRIIHFVRGKKEEEKSRGEFFVETLFGGLLENIREFFCWIWLRHRYLRPTYFSLGFLNIYPAAKKISNSNISERLVSQFFNEHLDHSEAKGFLDIFTNIFHTFGNPGNYGIYKGNLVLLDYGENGIFILLTKYQKAFESFFKMIRAN